MITCPRKSSFTKATFLAGENLKFQQDNVLVLTNNGTKRWFLFNNVKTLTWPAKSTDLNSFEKLWVDLARRVYANR